MTLHQICVTYFKPTCPYYTFLSLLCKLCDKQPDSERVRTSLRSPVRHPRVRVTRLHLLWHCGRIIVRITDTGAILIVPVATVRQH